MGVGHAVDDDVTVMQNLGGFAPYSPK